MAELNISAICLLPWFLHSRFCGFFRFSGVVFCQTCRYFAGAGQSSFPTCWRGFKEKHDETRVRSLFCQIPMRR